MFLNIKIGFDVSKYILILRFDNRNENNNNMTELQEFIEKMPHGKADEFRNKVVEACQITQAQFRLWRNGLKVPEKHHVIINGIAMTMFNKLVWKMEAQPAEIK